MTITIVQSRSVANAGFVTSTALAFSSSLTAGSTILAIGGYDGGGSGNTVSMTGSNNGSLTQVGTTQYEASQDKALAVFYKDNVSAGAETLTWNAGGTYHQPLFLIELSGTRSAGSLGTGTGAPTGATTSGATNPCASLSITPQEANCIVFSAYHNNSTTAPTPHSGFTTLMDLSSTDRMAVGYQIQTTATAVTTTWDGPAIAWAGLLWTIRAAAGGGASFWGGSISEQWNRIVQV